MTGFRAILCSRILILALLVLGLTGCGTFDFSDRSFKSSRKVVWLENSASGSRFEDFLVWSDRREIDTAAWSAATAETSDGVSTWSNPVTGSSGSVRTDVVYLVGFNSGVEIKAPVDLDVSVLLKPVAGDYITNANANVRLSPSVNGEKASLLVRGNRVKVIAQEQVRGWYLVTSSDRVVGYVFADLLDKVDGGDLLLVGGDVQYPKLCRELTYKMKFSSGKSDEWLNGVCREKNRRWSVVGGRSLGAAG